MSESEDVIDQSNHILALLEERKRKREGEHLLEVLPQGEGSGLDADKVDGLHADDIVENARKSIVVKAGGSGGGNIDTTGLLRADGTVPVTDYIDMHEHAVPANPAADTLRLYVEDVKGFPFFSFRDETGMIRKIVRDSVFVGKNVTGVTIPQFRAVYASGSADGVPTLALAKADSILTMPSIGITTEAIADGAYGRVMQVGLAENVNTNAFTEGDVIYVSAATAGLGTNVAPVYPNIAQEIGTVLVKDAAVGMFQCVARSMNNALGVGEHPQYVEVAGDTMTGDLTLNTGCHTDTIDEKTAATGVTIDGVWCRDKWVLGLDGLQTWSVEGNHTALTIRPNYDMWSQVIFQTWDGGAWLDLLYIYGQGFGNYVKIARCGDVTMLAARSLDCATNGGYFKPRRLHQSLAPTPDSGELLVWNDSDDDKTYLVYNDPDQGVRKVEMT